MAAITAALVAQLRERTGLGMMECKRALTETDGDLESAIELLRKKGTKDRGERVAGEGLVMGHVSDDGKTGVLIELNSETDFVARNEDFKGPSPVRWPRRPRIRTPRPSKSFLPKPTKMPISRFRPSRARSMRPSTGSARRSSWADSFASRLRRMAM